MKKKEKTIKVKNPNAYSNFKKGLDDYNDGGLNATHYLGNEDYDTNLSDENGVIFNEKFEGREAEGNDLSDEEEVNFND